MKDRCRVSEDIRDFHARNPGLYPSEESAMDKLKREEVTKAVAHRLSNRYDLSELLSDYEESEQLVSALAEFMKESLKIGHPDMDKALEFYAYAKRVAYRVEADRWQPPEDTSAEANADSVNDFDRGC